jgi:hypothetical protein
MYIIHICNIIYVTTSTSVHLLCGKMIEFEVESPLTNAMQFKEY